MKIHEQVSLFRKALEDGNSIDLSRRIVGISRPRDSFLSRVSPEYVQLKIAHRKRNISPIDLYIKKKTETSRAAAEKARRLYVASNSIESLPIGAVNISQRMKLVNV